MPTLNQEQITEELQTLKDWEHNGEAISKEYSFPDFGVAMDFVNQVAKAAEAAQHHPDIDIRYSKVKLALSTHSEGGITQKDIELARHIEEMTE